MLPEGTLRGGPYCGATLARASRGAWIWVGGELDKPKAYAKAGPNRLLYRSLGREGDREIFLMAAHSHAHCEGCGAYNELGEGEKNPHCQACGTPLVAV